MWRTYFDCARESFYWHCQCHYVEILKKLLHFFFLLNIFGECPVWNWSQHHAVGVLRFHHDVWGQNGLKNKAMMSMTQVLLVLFCIGTIVFLFMNNQLCMCHKNKYQMFLMASIIFRVVFINHTFSKGGGDQHEIIQAVIYTYTILVNYPKSRSNATTMPLPIMITMSMKSVFSISKSSNDKAICKI